MCRSGSPESAVRVLVSWSSGKDAAWVLHRYRLSAGVEVAALVSTVERETGRVAMHTVRRELLHAQAEALGLPLWEVALPWPCPNRVYEEAMAPIWRRARREGITAVAFGDLFLEDIRRYRERQLAGSGLEPRFPLWGEETARLVREMIDGGLRARVVAVDPERCPVDRLGRDLDAAFLEALPPGVDPCGERGEFHTFAYGGACFERTIAFSPGERGERTGQVFVDLLPGGGAGIT